MELLFVYKSMILWLLNEVLAGGNHTNRDPVFPANRKLIGSGEQSLILAQDNHYRALRKEIYSHISIHSLILKLFYLF